MESKFTDEEILVNQMTEKKLNQENEDLLLLNEMTEKKLEFENKESQTGDKWVHLKNLRHKSKHLPPTLFDWFVLVMKIFDALFPNKCCSKCFQYTLLTDYHTDRRAVDKYASACKKCAIISAAINRTLKFAIMRLNFEGKCCVDCGESNHWVLENDHVLDNKHITRTGRRSQSLVETPLDKLCDMLLTCEVVCTRCHAIRTESRIIRLNPEELSQNPGAIRSRNKRFELQQLVNTAKLNIGRCQADGCDFWDPNHLSIFQFNHINPETKIKGVADMVSDKAKKEDIIKEIEKCNLLCGNCHKIVTSTQRKLRSLEDFPQEVLREAKRYIAEAVERKKKADAEKSKDENGKRKIKNGDDGNQTKKQKTEEEKQ